VIDHKPEALGIGMLGGFSVGVGSRAIGQNEWRLKRATALIKLLALAPNHRLHREQVMDLLWPPLGHRSHPYLGRGRGRDGPVLRWND